VRPVVWILAIVGAFTVLVAGFVGYVCDVCGRCK
jgi:hypothetical protein